MSLSKSIEYGKEFRNNKVHNNVSSVVDLSLFVKQLPVFINLENI